MDNRKKVTFVIEAYTEWGVEDGYSDSFWQEVIPDDWLVPGYWDKLRKENIGEMFEKMITEMKSDSYWSDKIIIGGESNDTK